MDDKLQSVLWCVFKIIENRRRRKSAGTEHIVGEMNAVLELHAIMGWLK